MKERLDKFLRDPRTEIVLIGSILLSVGLVVVEVGLDPKDLAFGSIHLAGEVITGLFAVELLLRFWVAPRKSRFFQHYWVDLIAVAPLFRPLRFLRVIRLLRLHRVGLLVYRRLQYNSPTLATGLGLQLMVLLVVGVIILVGGMAMHLAEGGGLNEKFNSLGASLWWSFFTLISLQPTGGDPASDLGRLVAAFVVLGGLATVAVFTGVMSAVMIQRLKMGMEVRDVDLDELRGHIVICGWNRAAPLIVDELHADPAFKNQAIVAVAEFGETPDLELRGADRSRLYIHKGDFTRMDVLETVGIRHAARAILLADKCLPRSDQDRDARTVLAALTIEKMNPTVFTCAQLLDRKNNVQLQVAGVENIVIDDEISGSLIATTVRNLGLIGFISELLDMKVGNNLYKLALPAGWEKSSFGEASRRMKERHAALLVALERIVNGKRETLVNPSDALALVAGDELVVIALTRPEVA